MKEGYLESNNLLLEGNHSEGKQHFTPSAHTFIHVLNNQHMDDRKVSIIMETDLSSVFDLVYTNIHRTVYRAGLELSQPIEKITNNMQVLRLRFSA